MNNTTICFVAGKSGGHILPGITSAQNILKHHPHINVIFFATNNHLDKNILSQYSFLKQVIFLPIDTISYSKIYYIPIVLWQFICSFFTSLQTLYRSKPYKVISMGGIVSIPVCLAAYCLKIPVELYELNVIPGKAVTFLAPFAQTLFICFAQTQSYVKKKCIFTNYPIRFTETDRLSRDTALLQCNLSDSKKTMVIIGGSQGSHFLNTLMTQWLIENPDLHQLVQIIHQTGKNNMVEISKFYKTHNIPAHVFSYDAAIARYYSAADIIICRSGAGTLFESAFFNKPCITIPLETQTTQHQKNNAYAFAASNNYITVLEQNKLMQNPTLLTPILRSYIAS